MKQKKVSFNELGQAEAAQAGPGKMQQIKVMLADDHDIMRGGIRSVIEAEEDMRVVAEARNGPEAVTLAQRTAPDVILMDVNMPLMNGVDATKEILLANASFRIIGLSLHTQDYVRRSMLRAGACAYLTKGNAFNTLGPTIRNVLKLPGV